MIKKFEKTVLWRYVINFRKGNEIVGMFFEKELQKENQKKFRFEKVIKRKGDKLHVKWRGYNNSLDR